MQRIITFLSYNDRAEEAVNYYTAIFKNSKITNISRCGEGMHLPAGTVLVASFELEGQKFMALNAGPNFTFSQGISLYVNCDSQEEVDELWDKLSDGGEIQYCGWLKDKFGVSWQIIPTIFAELMNDEDPEKSGRVLQAMMQMRKFDIETLIRAYEG